MPFQNLLKKIANALDKRQIPYMIIGGQAVLVYGEPRLTRDIDVTLGVGVEERERVMSAISHIKLKFLTDDIESFVKKTMVLPALDEKSGVRVDFIFSFTPYERQAIERAKHIKFGRITVRFASPEDVVIHKVLAARPRDIEDIKSILLKNPNCDKKYIVKWLKEFDHSLSKNFSKTFLNIIKEIR